MIGNDLVNALRACRGEIYVSVTVRDDAIWVKTTKRDLLSWAAEFDGLETGMMLDTKQVGRVTENYFCRDWYAATR